MTWQQLLSHQIINDEKCTDEHVCVHNLVKDCHCKASRPVKAGRHPTKGSCYGHRHTTESLLSLEGFLSLCYPDHSAAVRLFAASACTGALFGTTAISAAGVSKYMSVEEQDPGTFSTFSLSSLYLSGKMQTIMSEMLQDAGMCTHQVLHASPFSFLFSGRVQQGEDNVKYGNC